MFSNRKSSLGKTMSVTPRKITFGDEGEEEDCGSASRRRQLMERMLVNKSANRQSIRHNTN